MEKIEEKKGRVVRELMFDDSKDIVRKNYNIQAREENCTIIVFPRNEYPQHEITKTQICSNTGGNCQGSRCW